MKKILIALLAITTVISAFAGEAKIDNESCTITKDGKTYKLYGKVKIVDSFEDIKVKIVEHFEDVKVKIVDSFEDIKVKIVNSFEGVKNSAIYEYDRDIEDI